MKLFEQLKKVKSVHLVVVLLGLIWIELGGLDRAETILGDAARFVRNIGAKEERPAPYVEGQGGLLDSYAEQYQYPAAASIPQR